jgi:hypothetical protein
MRLEISKGGATVTDLTGKQFGHLTVLEGTKYFDFTFSVWKCRCVCGDITYFSSQHLKAPTKGGVHCGCKHKNSYRDKIAWRKTLKNYEGRGVKYATNAPLSMRFSMCRSGSRKRNIDFTLTLAEYSALVTDACAYCGEYSHPYGGIDRENNFLGYTPENSVPCCAVCNTMKHKLTVEGLINHCKKIVAHRG